jgi:hypothetical protein
VDVGKLSFTPPSFETIAASVVSKQKNPDQTKTGVRNRNVWPHLPLHTTRHTAHNTFFGPKSVVIHDFAHTHTHTHTHRRRTVMIRSRAWSRSSTGRPWASARRTQIIAST